MQMKKLVSVLLALLLSAGVFAAVQSNSVQQAFFVAEPVVLTLVQPFPATMYKTNTYTSTIQVQNNGADIPAFYGNIQVLNNGSPYDGTGLAIRLYDATAFYNGSTPYATVEEYIANGSPYELALSFNPATGTYVADVGLLVSGSNNYVAMQVSLGSNWPSGNYSLNAYGSDS